MEEYHLSIHLPQVGRLRCGGSSKWWRTDLYETGHWKINWLSPVLRAVIALDLGNGPR
jgi:hypothetical protein